MRQSKWDEAIAALQKSIWLNPYYSGPYILLGRAYMKKEQPATAEGMLRRAIQYDPNNRAAHYLLGQLLQQTGRPEEAKREFEIAERLQGQPGPLSGARAPCRVAGAAAAPWLPARRRAAVALAPRVAGRSRQTPRPWPVTFTDVAERAGLRAPVVYGGVDRKRFIIETNGAGVALVDYDHDGWLDALVLSGTRLDEGAARRGDVSRRARRRPTACTATAATAPSRTSPTRAGLRRTGWASSVCAGDYDNDGWLDLFVTYYGTERALPQPRRRPVRGRDRARPASPRPACAGDRAARFVDYDRDGRLDLFVANYLRFDLATARRARAGRQLPVEGHRRSTAGPKGLPTDTNLLYRNQRRRHVRATSRTRRASRSVTGRYPMTAAAADLDGDGWPDIYVASDSTAAILYRNNRDGTFTDVARRERRRLQRERQRAGGHGRRGRRLQRRRPARRAQDALRRRHPRALPQPRQGPVRGRRRRRGPRRRRTATSSGAPACRTSTTTACTDLVYVTGNVYPEIERVLPQYPHRGPRVVFRNTGGGRFEDVTARERRRRDARTRAAAPRSATSTTTATSTCSS